VQTLMSLARLFRKTRPDIVIAYTAKPVIYGALAARMTGVLRFSAMITGLGFSFIDGPEKSRYVARIITSKLYKVALRYCSVVIFQNPDDRKTFIDLGFLSSETPIGLINGSGVDIGHYQVTQLPEQPVFLMIVREFAEASRLLKQADPSVRTILVGGIDQSPNSISPDEIKVWIANGMEYLGHLDDVRSAISLASVVVLPSYREGTPRSVLEGMAMGRAIITTDTPGCRETVAQNVNGLLVPPRNVAALYGAMKVLAEQKYTVERMAVESRKMAEDKYEGKSVAREIMRLVGAA
jgi:glycosyltransferase involved in cell wall biosynthesis